MNCSNREVVKKTTKSIIPLVVVVGPTASGKSSLAMRIAQKYSGEIICADSRTVYKGMDIGTAKPTDEDRTKVRHHILDLVELNSNFSAANFKSLAEKSIKEISERRNVPIIVGGTGLYVDSVLFDYRFGKVSNSNERLVLEQKSIKELQSLCTKKDIILPENSKNRRHLIRALENRGLIKQDRCIRDNTIVVGISTERDILRSRIRGRIEQMFAAGIIDEVKKLVQKYGWESEAMTGDIYRSCRDIIKDGVSVEGAIEDCVRRDMALAKRQMTWFKRNKSIIWSDSLAYLEDEVDRFVDDLVHKN
ncbi:MAG: tRNA (adenosine(37)-N6)-dimethylallyltransferase MiaA [Candidatus Woesebacteria bacterium]|jgi:tRNA dimethylallyltransferase